jgi:hypothetical protein
MAMTYQNFASLGVNLNRQKYGPLDISNVFTSAADLKYYLTKGTFTEGVSEYWYKNANEKIVPYPYEGQVLATVIDGVVNVYALSLDAEGNFQTQEIAGKIEVDGKTIKLNADGKLELVGLPADIAGKTLVPSLVNGVLTWAEPDTSTAEGQAQEIEGLKTRATALEETINGKGEGEEHVAGLVEKVAALEAVDNATQAELDAYKAEVTAAIAAGVQEAKDHADQNDADTQYDDTALSNRVKAIEDDYLKAADKYNDAEVRELIADLNEAIGDTEGGLVKDIADNKQAIADEKARAEAAEKALGERIDGIDFVDTDELNAALEPINTALGTKAAQADLEALANKVNAFLTGEGTEAALDSLQELIAYIDAHDGADLTEMIATIEGIEGKLAGIDGTVAEYVAAAIEALKIGDYAKAADLTALAGRVEALEAKPFDDYATKTEVSAVDAKFADYTTTADLNAALADKVDSSAFETFKGENTTAIGDAKDAAIAAAKTETESQVGALKTEVARDYATKGELTEAVEGIENDLAAYAKSADVNAELAKKVENATIAHAVAADPDNGIEAIPEGVTKEGTTLKIVVDAPTRAETTQMIADKVAAVTGGESAAAVKLLVEAEVERSTAKDEAHDAALATLQGDASKAGSVAEAKALAQKGVDDAAKVAADLVTANGLIADNAREIGVVKGSITDVNETLGNKIAALETAKGEQATQISGLDGRLTTAESGITTNSSDINTIKGQITALGNEDTRLAGLIEGLGTSKANAADVYTKGEADTAIGNAIDAKLVDVNAAIADKANTSDVNAALDLKANAADVYAKADVYTKDEANAEFMTEAEVDARINTLIVGADPEGGKAITDIQNLVKYVDENAGDIAALVTANDANTAKLAGIDTTVTAYVNDALAAKIQPKASDEISVAEDGTLGIIEMNVNKLVQTEGDVLILNGGSATA